MHHEKTVRFSANAADKHTGHTYYAGDERRLDADAAARFVDAGLAEYADAEDLREMTKDELKEVADEHAIPVPAKASKEEMVKAIEEGGRA